MNWERLNSPEFEKSAGICEGVCLLPMGVIEKHGDHLPLGQDAIYVHKVCTMAAEREAAMVFPLFYFGQIMEGKMVPGTISLGSDLLMPLLERVCDEISRNGFKTILVVNGHGGNSSMLGYFLFSLLDKKKDYMVYVTDPPHCGMAEKTSGVFTAKIDGHGGEKETSCMLHLFPDLVKMEKYGAYGRPLKRDLKFAEAGIRSGVWWYANHPEHFSADDTPCTPEKGRIFVEAHVEMLVGQIRLLKRDRSQEALYREYLERSERPRNNASPGGAPDASVIEAS